jgi:hypothetical protein
LTHPLIRRLAVLGTAAVQAVLLGACATITGDPTQVVHIETLDEHGQPIQGMRCHLSNASSDYYGDSPLFDLEVHRSSSDLKIACHLGNRVAEGRAVSRSGVRGAATGMVDLLLPGGSAYAIVDHLTGYRYTYPTWLQLQVGQKLVFDAGDDVSGKPVPVASREPLEPQPSIARKAPAEAPPPARNEPQKPAPADTLPIAERVLVRTD